MAGIIKSGSRLAPQVSPSAIFEFYDLAEEDDATKARKQAEAIIKQAQAEADSIRAKAKEEGHRAAMQAAEVALKSRVEQQLGSLVPALKQAVQQIIEARQVWQRHWEHHALRLSTAIASRVVRREVQRIPLIAIELIREALQLAVGNERIVLRLNPHDLATLGDQAQQLLSEMGSLAETKVVGDPAISAGGCRVDTEFGSIDQQLETQLARITEELLA